MNKLETRVSAWGVSGVDFSNAGVFLSLTRAMTLSLMVWHLGHKAGHKAWFRVQIGYDETHAIRWSLVFTGSEDGAAVGLVPPTGIEPVSHA